MADLDPQRIAEAALALVSERGLEAFTMRAVADALGVTPMALYHHVKDKAELAILVIDAASRGRPLPAPTGQWREDLVAMALWTREGTLAAPALSRLRSMYQVWTPAMLHMTEHWMSLWRQSGLPAETAVQAGTLSSRLVVGVIEHELSLRVAKAPDPRLLDLLPNARLAFQAERNPETDFLLMVRAVIDGLASSLQAPN